MELSDFIKDILTSAKIKQKYIDTLTSPSSLSYFITAFTDPSYDSENNYLYFRTLGTVTLHKIFVWYTAKKFEGVNPKILTQIKINFLKVSKLGEYMETLKFGDYILYDPKLKMSNKIIEMVFEAFIGTIELLINKNYKVGIGYVVVNKLCTYFLEKLNINLDELKLSDSKTKLKELFMSLNSKIEYTALKDDSNIFHVEVFMIDEKREKLGEGSGKTIISGEQEAAKKALEVLKSRGIYKREKDKTKFVDRNLINYAPRDERFMKFVLHLLGRINFLVDVKLDKEDMTIFEKAFTHPDVNSDPLKNYELLETLGDNTLNKCVLWYISSRFPQLNCPEGIEILTRLKIMIINTTSFSKLAEQLGFFNYISCLKNPPIITRMEIMEDVFESFFAAVEIIIDKKYKPGMGYIICYRLISNILDQEQFSISYDKLVDPKTRLKEMFNQNKNIMIEYRKLKNEFEGNNEVYSSYIVESKLIEGTDSYGPLKPIQIGKNILIGKGYTIKEAEQDVSKKVLEYYKSKQITKQIPKEYLKFCM